MIEPIENFKISPFLYYFSVELLFFIYYHYRLFSNNISVEIHVFIETSDNPNVFILNFTLLNISQFLSSSSHFSTIYHL